MIWKLIVIGILIVINGIIVLKHKKWGPEEGLTGFCIKGNVAKFVGIIMVLLGLLLVCLGVADVFIY